MIDAKLVGFSEKQEQKILEAVKQWDAVWMSKDFEQAVMKARFTQTNAKKADIYANITRECKGHGLVIKIELNSVKNGSETASTNTETGLVTLQSWYVESSSINDLVNTLSHESTHRPSQGAYTHSKYYNRWLPYLKLRPWSIPYQVGDITAQIAKRMFVG